MADVLEIDVASALAEFESQADSTWPSWDFCLLYEALPYAPITLSAPSAEAAALTMSQLVDKLNRMAAQMGFPPQFSWASGVCPPGGR